MNISNLRLDDLSRKDLFLLLKDALKEPIQKTESISLMGFVKEYITYSKYIYSNKYVSSITLSLNHLLSFLGQSKSLREISIKDADMFVNNLKKQAPKGYEVYFRTLKAAFNKALDWEYITQNPFTKIKLAKVQKNKTSYLNFDDLNKVLKYVDNLVLKDLFKTAYFTGCRLSEITNLRYSNIDLKDNIITIGDENFTTKSRRQRLIPIASELREILLKYRKNNCNENSLFVFRKSNGHPYTNEYVSKYFKRNCRIAGLDESVHFHTIRHSFASSLISKNVPTKVVQELLGHASVQTTEQYLHVNRQDLKDAICKLN